MATGKSTTIYVRAILTLILVLLLTAFVSGRDSNGFKPDVASIPSQAPLKCSSAYAVKNGDTCFDIARQAGLDTTGFQAINPNLICEKLFVGQWVCIKA